MQRQEERENLQFGFEEPWGGMSLPKMWANGRPPIKLAHDDGRLRRRIVAEPEHWGLKARKPNKGGESGGEGGDWVSDSLTKQKNKT